MYNFPFFLFLLLIASAVIYEIPSTTSSILSVRFNPSNYIYIVYFIQIVPSTLPHLPRLFRRVYHPNNVYALHFDVKIPHSDVDRIIHQLQLSVSNYRQNTHIVPPDVIVYNGVSMILNTLAAMTFSLDVPQAWSFFINLSGSDYPLTDAYLPRQLLAQALPYSPLFFSLAHEESWKRRFQIRASYVFIDPSLTHASNNPPLIQTTTYNPVSDWNFIRGRVFHVGDNIDTDQIIPAECLTLVPSNPEEYLKLGTFSMDGLPIDLYPQRYVESGALQTEFPIIVADDNFGCGSSREHAPVAISAAGGCAIVAKSYARILFRNCSATGELYPWEVDDEDKEKLITLFETGQQAEIDFEHCLFRNLSTGSGVRLKPLGDVQPVIDAGGNFEYARQTGMISKK